MKSKQRLSFKKSMVFSVPLRGRGNEIPKNPLLQVLAGNIEFPSPCGEEVMK